MYNFYETYMVKLDYIFYIDLIFLSAWYLFTLYIYVSVTLFLKLSGEGLRLGNVLCIIGHFIKLKRSLGGCRFSGFSMMKGR